MGTRLRLVTALIWRRPSILGRRRLGRGEGRYVTGLHQHVTRGRREAGSPSSWNENDKWGEERPGCPVLPVVITALALCLTEMDPDPVSISSGEETASGEGSYVAAGAKNLRFKVN